MELSGSSSKSISLQDDPVSSPAAKTAPPIRVALTMALKLDRMAWSVVIGNQADMELIAATASSRQVINILNSQSSDVVLIDDQTLGLCDRDALLASASRPHSPRLILIAMHQPDYSIEPPQFPFIHTRLLKGISAPELLKSIRDCANDVARISPGP